jgi:P27 family predicted phage terminase small subunit
MVAKNTYDETCVTTLAAFCVQYARFVEAEEAVHKQGVVIRTKRGSPRCNPYVAYSNLALDRAHKLARQLGLSPASRSQVTRTRTTPGKPAARKFLSD